MNKFSTTTKFFDFVRPLPSLRTSGVQTKKRNGKLLESCKITDKIELHSQQNIDALWVTIPHHCNCPQHSTLHFQQALQCISHFTTCAAKSTG
jgi:hypothetical protein